MVDSASGKQITTKIKTAQRDDSREEKKQTMKGRNIRGKHYSRKKKGVTTAETRIKEATEETEGGTQTSKIREKCGCKGIQKGM